MEPDRLPPPYYHGGQATVYQADALAVLAALPAGSVDALITDPPYSSGGQYKSDRAQGVHTKYVNSDSGNQRLPGFSGDNRDQRSYGYWCTLWLGQALRVVKPGGVCALFTDWRQLPTTTDALQAGGWVWRGVVPWYKPNGRRVQGRWANQCEYVVWGTNGPRPLDVRGPVAFPGFFQANPPRVREHITQKPLDVLRHLVTIAEPGGAVLDTFAGSGTTGVAALAEGRRFVGVELAAEHCATIARRLQGAGAGTAAGQPDLFDREGPQ